MKAISVRQPWAWLLIHGTKDIESRDWYTKYRGPIAIHAAKGMTRFEYEDAVDFVRHIAPELADSIPAPSELVRGAIIGTMVLRDCRTQRAHDTMAHPSPWFQGPYGFVMDTPQPCDPVKAGGALGLWDWQPPKGPTE